MHLVNTILTDHRTSNLFVYLFPTPVWKFCSALSVFVHRIAFLSFEYQEKNNNRQKLENKVKIRWQVFLFFPSSSAVHFFYYPILIWDSKEMCGLCSHVGWGADRTVPLGCRGFLLQPVIPPRHPFSTFMSQTSSFCPRAQDIFHEWG